MSEEQHATPDRPATDRAEEMLSRLGQRFTDVRTTMGRALDQRAQKQSGSAGPARPTPQRAEDTLADWGERVGYFAGTAGLRLRQWGARAREEAEDLWAEAQSMREQQNAGNASTGTDTTATTKPATKQATKQATKPITKATTKPTAKPATKPTTKPTTKKKATKTSHDQGAQTEQLDESARPS